MKNEKTTQNKIGVSEGSTYFFCFHCQIENPLNLFPTDSIDKGQWAHVMNQLRKKVVTSVSVVEEKYKNSSH